MLLCKQYVIAVPATLLPPFLFMLIHHGFTFRHIQIFFYLSINDWDQFVHIYKVFKTGWAVQFTLQFHPVTIILVLFFYVNSILNIKATFRKQLCITVDVMDSHTAEISLMAAFMLYLFTFTNGEIPFYFPQQNIH
jgi:hypothetical protein